MRAAGSERFTRCFLGGGDRSASAGILLQGLVLWASVALADGDVPRTSSASPYAWALDAIEAYLLPAGADSFGHCRGEVRGPQPSGLLAGARRVFVEMYQDCAVLDVPPLSDGSVKVADGMQATDSNSLGTYTFRTITDPEKYRMANPYLKPMTSRPGLWSMCIDPRVSPPIYAYGARPRVFVDSLGVESVSLHIDRTLEPLCMKSSGVKGASGVGSNGVVCAAGSGDNEAGSPAVRALDCSGFVQAAFMMEGLRIRPGREINPALDGTYAFHAAGDDPKSCLGKVSMGAQVPPFQPGDLFVTGGRHMVVFDSVGPDPLGIGTVSDCNELSPENFNFTVIQSSPFGGGIGVQRTEGRAFYANTGEHATQFLALARSYCELQKASSSLGGAERAVAKIPAATGHSAILRHKGAAMPGCLDPDARMKPEGSCPGLEDCDFSRTGLPEFGLWIGSGLRGRMKS